MQNKTLSEPFCWMITPELKNAMLLDDELNNHTQYSDDWFKRVEVIRVSNNLEYNTSKEIYVKESKGSMAFLKSNT